MLHSPQARKRTIAGEEPPSSLFFTCGRRPAGLLVTLVVVVVGGGGNNFYTFALPETMYGLEQIKNRSPYFSSFFLKKISKDHVWF